MTESRMRNVPLDVVVFSKPVMVLQLAMKAQRPISKPAKATLDAVAGRSRLIGQAEEEGSTAGAEAAAAASVCSCASVSSDTAGLGVVLRLNCLLAESSKTRQTAAAVVWTAATTDGLGALPSPCKNRYLMAGALVPQSTALQTSTYNQGSYVCRHRTAAHPA